MQNFLKTKNISDQTYIKFTYPGIVLVWYGKVTVSSNNIEISHILIAQNVDWDIVNADFL